MGSPCYRKAWPGRVWAPAEQGSIIWNSCASCQNLLLVLGGFCSFQALQVAQGGFGAAVGDPGLEGFVCGGVWGLSKPSVERGAAHQGALWLWCWGGAQ